MRYDPDIDEDDPDIDEDETGTESDEEDSTAWEGPEVAAQAADDTVYDGSNPDDESEVGDRVGDRVPPDADDGDVQDADVVEAELETPPDFVSDIRWVPLGDLVVEYKFWTNPRRFTGLDPQSIKDLAADVSAKTRQVMTDGGHSITYAGIDDPLLVVRIAENGGVVHLVVDGQRRERAVRQAYLKDPDVLVPVRDLESEAVIWTQELSNKFLADSLKKVGLRSGLSAFELAKNAEFLRTQRDGDTNKEFTLERIAGVVGRSESWVSKILSALRHATPKLVHQWERGDITEEQFRDLAAQKNPEAQDTAAAAVVKARTSGDSGGGRTLAKEQLELSRAARVKPVKPETEDKPVKAKKGRKPVVSGPQTAVSPRKAPPFAVVEDMLETARRKPPTHEYVKGMLDGVRWASGCMDAALLGKPWQLYLQRVTEDGEPSGSKPEPEPRKSSKKTSKKK
jgi:hypothetical protein